MNAENGHPPPGIGYPCRWSYKVIGSDEAGMRAAIDRATSGKGDVSAFRSSATGKYQSLHVDVWIENEQARMAVYETLRRDPSVKMVL
jgi:putative lipoic acid-binding regulatory protein